MIMGQSSLPPTFQERDLTYYLRMIQGDFSEFEEISPKLAGRSEKLKDVVIIFGSDSLGIGKKMLGKKLMLLFLQALINSPVVPRAIILLNSAVLMAEGKTDVLGKLMVLEEQGSKIMACISSTDEYEITDNINVGYAAGMDEICEVILTARKVISL